MKKNIDIESTLKRSEERFRIAASLASDLIFEWNSEDDRIEGYGDLEKLLGYPKAEQPRTMKDAIDLIHPDERDHVKWYVDRCIETGEDFVTEFRAKKKDGSYALLMCKAQAISGEKGRHTIMMGAINDISARKMAADEITGWKQRYDLIVASSGQVIYDYNVKTGEIIWGGGIKEVLGCSERELNMGIDQWTDMIHPEDRPHILKLLDSSQKTFIPFDCEYRFRHKKGHYLWMRDRGFFVADSRGVAIRMLGVMQDITERKRVDEELVRNKEELFEWSSSLEKKIQERNLDLKRCQDRIVQNERLAVLGQVSATLSHEMRAPLSSIRSAVELLDKLNAGGDRKVYDQLGLIKRGMDDCVRMLNNMIDFVRIKEPVKRETKLEGVVQKFIKTFSLPQNIKVTTDLGPDVPPVEIDHYQIQQVLDNVVRNAVAAMPSGGDLKISTGVQGEYAFIEIADTGVGISQQDLDKIFDPLFSTTPNGVGLGLSIARQFIESHDGVIDVKSESGKGTSVRLKLPLK